MTTHEFETLQFVASESVPQVLRELDTNMGLALPEALLRHAEPARAPFLTEQFLRFNLVADPELLVTSRGRVCCCGIAIIEGASIAEAVDRLREIDPASNRIALVREGMTSVFIKLVQRLDSIRRIMICSPWVSLGRDRLHDLAAGIERSKRQSGFLPELTVVTRPVDDQPEAANNETVQYFQRVGAAITFRPNLHSKLYIVEAAGAPPQRYAFVGSENFTKVRYQEVGIRVNNDNQVIDDLVRYLIKLTE